MTPSLPPALVWVWTPSLSTSGTNLCPAYTREQSTQKRVRSSFLIYAPGGHWDRLCRGRVDRDEGGHNQHEHFVCRLTAHGDEFRSAWQADRCGTKLDPMGVALTGSLSRFSARRGQGLAGFHRCVCSLFMRLG